MQSYVCPGDMAQRSDDQFIEIEYNIRNDNFDSGNDRSDITSAAISNDAAFIWCPTSLL